VIGLGALAGGALLILPAAVELACDGRRASEADLVAEGYSRSEARDSRAGERPPLLDGEVYQLRRGEQRAVCILGACCLRPTGSGVLQVILPAQSDMPVLPPPSQRGQQPGQPPGQPPRSEPAPPGRPQQPPLPPGAQPGVVRMEDLARVGFEVKSMAQAGQRPGSYIVLMQRAGDVRTCLLRIAFTGVATPPTRQSACF
jgi:hypothetical protein